MHFNITTNPINPKEDEKICLFICSKKYLTQLNVSTPIIFFVNCSFPCDYFLIFFYFDSCHSGLKLAWSSPLLRGLSSLPLLLNHLSLAIRLQRLWLCRLFLHMVKYPQWQTLFFWNHIASQYLNLQIPAGVAIDMQAKSEIAPMRGTIKHLLFKIKVSNKIDTHHKWPLKYWFFSLLTCFLDVIWSFLRCLCKDLCIWWPR